MSRLAIASAGFLGHEAPSWPPDRVNTRAAVTVDPVAPDDQQPHRVPRPRDGRDARRQRPEDVGCVDHEQERDEPPERPAPDSIPGAGRAVKATFLRSIRRA
jgi:hypothetical protein